MNQIFKIGDKISCHTRCKMNGGDYCTTIDKIYTIVDIDKYNSRFAIIDDEKHPHWFSNDFETWFSSKRQIRKNKLLKLNEY